LPPDQERPGFDLGSELKRLNGTKAVGRGSRPSWRFWGLVFWAVLATAIAIAALGEPGPARRAGLEPPDAPVARPSLPDSAAPSQAAEVPWTVTFRNFAYFETATLLQLALILQERERLAAEVENFRRLAAGCPPPAAPEDDDPQWVGLPPAPGMLHLDDPHLDPDLFFQPPSPPAGPRSAGPRSAYPDFLEDFFDPDSPAE
jgi:hypothetical protein